MSLSGKVAIVTGSGRGLGLAYARELARQGAAVVINDVDAEVAADAVRTIESDGGRAAAVVAPVGSSDVAKQLVQAAVTEFGRLDILVTNAGILRDKSLLKMTDEDFDAVINVHLRGTFTCAREAFGYFKEHGIRRPHHHHRLPDRPARQLRPDQLRRRQGRHRGHGPHLGAGNEEGRRHRQRRHPRGRHRHDQDRPVLPEGRRGRRARRGDAGLLPPRPRVSARPTTSPGWSPSSPPTLPPASPARRSAPAVTGCSSGPTPRPPPPNTARAAGATRTSWRTSARSSGTSCRAWARTSCRCRRTCSPNRPRSAEMAARALRTRHRRRRSSTRSTCTSTSKWTATATSPCRRP